MADEGKSKAAALAASLPPPDKLVKSGSDGGSFTAAPDLPLEGDGEDMGKQLALEDFDAAAPGSAERMKALEDFVYMCIQKHKDGG